MPNRRQGNDAEPEQTPKTVNLARASLEARWPDGRVTTHAISGDILRIGREPESNDLVIPEEFGSISRRHFELRRQGAAWEVVDLDTTNGVYLGGERIEGATPLSPGDEIRIGAPEYDHAVRFVFKPGSAGAGDGVEAAAALGTGTQDPQADISGPTLELHLERGRVQRHSITSFPWLVGRGEAAQLRIDQGLRYVSAQHFEIRRQGSELFVVDLGSTNGTLLNGRRLEPHEPTRLQDRARLRIGDDELGISIGFTFRRGREDAGAPHGYAPSEVRPVTAQPGGRTLLGRGSAADIQLDSVTVSRRHAVLERRGEGYWIRDLGSLNGTMVNGAPVDEAPLTDGDVVEIQDHALVFRAGKLHQYHAYGARLDGRHLVQRVKSADGPRTILDDVSLTVHPREFIALVGPSGAGKSTLMNALMGVWPAEGQVLVNGRDLYTNYERFRKQIGYVPQDDILHTSLTVEQALDYAAQLRLPPDLSRADRMQEVERVLATVGMDDPALRDTRIENLSGGQRKRVSIAAELLADPKLFFLDEATSGLDPGLEKKMMHTLRRMADEGRTVILITHATANIVQVDHVAFMEGGMLTYLGPPLDALEFFDVDEFADIYERIQGKGEQWRSKFLKSGSQADPRAGAVGGMMPELSSQRLNEGGLRRIASGLRQLRVLTRRTFSVLTSDRLQLLLLLLMFPLAALFLIVVSSTGIMTGDPTIIADPARAAGAMTESYTPYDALSTFIFTLALDGVLIGMFLPSNELIEERVIYLRERMVNLGVAPYVLSKVIVFTGFIGIQALLSILVLRLGLDSPAAGAFLPFGIELFGSLFLTMLAGVGIGLVISAVSRTPDMATYILVVLTFFQFFFSGTAFDLRGHPAEALTFTTATRWSMLGIGTTIDVRRQVESTVLCRDPQGDSSEPSALRAQSCSHFPEAVDDLILDYQRNQLPGSWAVLTLMGLICFGLTGVLVRRIDPL